MGSHYVYIHGDQVDEPWVQYNTSAIGDAHRKFLHADHQGSIIAITNTHGAAVNTFEYDVYGIPAAKNIERFGYTGQLYFKGLGLYYYKARIYHPKLGRFLQTDPVGYEDQMNLYAYVGNDPVNYNDPTGMTRWKANFGVKIVGVTGGAVNFGVSFDDETFELSFSAGGSLRAGGEVGTDISFSTEPSSYKGNTASAKATADVSLGLGEETAKYEGEYSTATGGKHGGSLDSALKVDGNGVNLNPNLGASAGVGGQGQVNISIPDTVNNVKNAVSSAASAISSAIDRCTANPGTAC